MTEWKTGNGRKEYFDDGLGHMVPLDAPDKFIAYIVNQYAKMYHMTKGIVHYGESISEMTEKDIDKAREAIKMLLGESI